MPTNYRKQMDEIIENIRTERQEPGQVPGRRPRLLMHVCCAPCSSSCLVQVRDDFDISVFFYNPNITEQDEYEKRLQEEKRLVLELNETQQGCIQQSCIEQSCIEQSSLQKGGQNEIQIIEGDYEPNLFLTAAKGYEKDPEGGERCKLCFELRLRETARVAAEQGFDFFTTSLTLSPLKNAALLNEIGEKAGEAAGVKFLPSDFKKKDGYLLSLKLSKEHDLYRQDYCGCIYSKAERQRQANKDQEQDPEQ